MKSFMKYLHSRNLTVFGFIMLVVSFFLSLTLGSSEITLKELFWGISGNETFSTAKNILLYVRLPRTLAAMLSGAGLAASGAVLQGALSNKLASPGIIGVNSGAGLGVSICALIGAASGTMISGFAFLGSFLAVWAVAFAAIKTKASRSTVILGGVAVNAVLNAVSESLSVLSPENAIINAEFRVGGFSSVSYTTLIPAGILIIAGIILLLTLLNDLDVLSMGDETAGGLGMSVKKTRLLFLIVAALLSGASVSFSGLLGFVGLIIPNFIREAVGSESKKLIPLCIIYGAAFVTLCDIAARMLFSPYELPVGIIMAIIGGPFFVFILLRNKADTMVSELRRKL